MQYIQRDRLIHIEWAIFRGTSDVPEDFSRALVKMFLIGNNEKYLLTATAQGGKLLADLPEGLPEGAYSLEALWVKNYGNLLPHRQPLTPGGEPVCPRRPGQRPNDPAFLHPHDHRFNNRCLMRSRKDYVFALTDYPSEETYIGESGEATVRCASSVATYGYDGLSAYEIAVMRGDFSGTEGEYLEALKYELEVATDEKLGGIKASAKTDNETVEAKIGPDGKLYVPAAASEELKTATETTLGGIRAATKTSLETQEVKIDPVTGKLYTQPGGEGGVEIVNNPDDEDLHSVEKSADLHVLQFADKEYNASAFSGLGRVYLRKNISSNKNILTQAMMSKTNTRYIIQYDYDLDGETITVPEGCILEFEGGSIQNGTLVGNYTAIKSALRTIFVGNIALEGTYNVPEAYPEWFGAIGDGANDDYLYIKKALDSFEVVKLSHSYYISNTLSIDYNHTLKGRDKKHSIIVLKSDIDAIIVYRGSNLCNLRVKIDNETYSHSAVTLSDGGNGSDFSYIGNIEIAMTQPSGLMCSENSIGVYICSSFAKGLYFNKIDRVDVRFARVAFYAYAGKEEDNSTCYINSNFVTCCRSFGCGTAIKTRVKNGYSEIKGNVFDVNHQNHVDLVSDYLIYDMATNYEYGITQNIVKGKVWDLSITFESGCLLGNIGGNLIETDYRIVPFNNTNNYIFLGTLIASNDGLSQAHIKMSNYLTEQEFTLIALDGTLKCSYVISKFSSIEYGVRSGSFISDIQYVNIDGIYYIYIHCGFKGYVIFNYNDSYNFTPTPYTVQITSLPEGKGFKKITPTLRYSLPVLSGANEDKIRINESSWDGVGVSTYNSELHRPRYWDTEYETWLNPLGQEEGLMRGNSEDRPTLNQYKSDGFMFLDYTLGKPIWLMNGKWCEHDGTAAHKSRGSGGAPSLSSNDYGAFYFERGYSKPMWWDGTKWRDAMGKTNGVNFGMSDARPTGLGVDKDYGFEFFDVELGKPIWWAGNKWVDATGAEV